MRSDVATRCSVLLIILLPVVAWVSAANVLWSLPGPGAYLNAALATPGQPMLIIATAMGLLLALGCAALMFRSVGGEFAGAPYRKLLRGPRVVSGAALARGTKEHGKQVTVGGVPMPREAEPLHLLVTGATGTGKSVLMRELAWSAMWRGDRMVIVDPNADMYSRFGRPRDLILNPHDARTQGWTFYNEIRADYDWQRYALSLVPRGRTSDAEEWNAYGRLLLRETARKLKSVGDTSIRSLFQWTTIADPKDLKEFLAGTDAESLFVGAADKALASARFVLSDKLSAHANMPAGDFSIREWLQSGTGNLYITWREDMAASLKPLIGSWVDVICTSVLSLPEQNARPLWLFLGELASLDKLASLVDALTKGRKHGLRVVPELQSTSQLESIYGREDAQTLLACFRSLVVLGGSKADPKTCEDMSKSLGEHEVERDKSSRTSGRNSSRNLTTERNRERLVTPAEIASQPDLSGYVAFAGDQPIAKVRLKPMNFGIRNEAFVDA